MRRIIGLVFSLGCLLYGIRAHANIYDSLRSDLNRGNYYTSEGNFTKADSFFGNAVKTVQQYENHYPDVIYDTLFRNLKFEVLYGKAWCQTLMLHFTAAEAQFRHLIKLASLAKDTINYSLALNGLSSMYGKQQNYDSSVFYAEKSLVLAQKINYNTVIFRSQSNLGDVYYATGQYAKSLEKYLEVKKMAVAMNKNEAISEGNLALVYTKLNKKELAEQHYLSALRLSKENHPVLYSIILPSYGELLYEKGEYRKLRKLLLEAVNDSKYMQMPDYHLAYLELLAKVYPRHAVSVWWTVLMAAILCLTVVLGIRIVLGKNRKLKNQHQSLLEFKEMVKNLKSALKENDSVEVSKILGKEQTVQLVGLFESLPELERLMRQLRNRLENKEDALWTLKQLEDIMKPLTTKKIEKDLSLYVEKQNKDFFEKLKERHPDLSMNDLRLCLLINTGLNTKEIASLTNKSVRGVESAKFRLRKKLDIDSSQDTYDYLLEIDRGVKVG